MVNIIITLFIFTFLVTQKILLLNEESLILLCFIMFILLSVNNLGISLNNSLRNQSIQISESLIYSLKNLLITLKKHSLLKEDFRIVFLNFSKFKDHYNHLILILGNLISSYTKYNLILAYNKRLLFIDKVEKQTIKLLNTIIIKKLGSIVKIKYFYNSSIKITSFLNLNTILLRECIQLINLNKT